LSNCSCNGREEFNGAVGEQVKPYLGIFGLLHCLSLSDSQNLIRQLLIVSRELIGRFLVGEIGRKKSKEADRFSRIGPLMFGSKLV
jgi:hypothetical protein